MSSSLDENMEQNLIEQVGPAPYKKISGSDLNDLFGQEERFKNSIIMDIRSDESFKTEHVKTSYNIPNVVSEGNESFATKAAAMEYFLDKLSSHIAKINVPGHYDEIIVYDENSHDGSIGNPLDIMVKAITKWNEDTKTNVWYLEGGIQAIKMNFPQLLTNEDESLPPPLEFPPMVTEFPMNPPEYKESRKVAKLSASFYLQMQATEEAIEKTGKKVELHRNLRVLEEINSIPRFDDCLGNRSPIGKRLEGEIQSIKKNIKMINEQLKEIKNRMYEMNAEWTDIMEKDKDLCLTRGFAEILYTTSTRLNELEMTFFWEAYVRKNAPHAVPLRRQAIL